MNFIGLITLFCKQILRKTVQIENCRFYHKKAWTISISRNIQAIFYVKPSLFYRPLKYLVKKIHW